MENANISTVSKSLEESYLSGKFQDAIKLMEENAGLWDKGVFHFNLGTLYLKTKEYPLGRLHLEKALKSGLNDRAVFKNLDLAIAQIKPFQETRTSLSDDALGAMASVPVSGALTLSLLLALLCMGIFYLKKIKRYPLLISLIVASFIPFAFSALYLNRLQTAVALRATEVREGPSAIYGVSTEIPAGTKITVGEVSEGWIKVRSPSSALGWIKSEDLGII